MGRSFASLQRQHDNMLPDTRNEGFTTCDECKEWVHDDYMHDEDTCQKCYDALPRCETHGVLWSGRDECEDCEGEE